MHRGESHESRSDRTLTQAEADNCCALSEGETSSPSAAAFAAAISFAVLGPGTGLPAGVPALGVSDNWRIASPIPASPHVARHVLLSVFLV